MKSLRYRLLAAVTIGLLAGAPIGAAAQSEGSSAEEASAPAAGINADRVDGKHAVGATTDNARRARKLVATNRRGFLPSNIVKPLWGLIRDIPAVLADGVVGWGEVANKPAGFADGVDNVGVAKVRVVQIDGAQVDVAAGSGPAGFFLACPEGSVVVGGGYSTPLKVVQSRPDGPSDPGDPWGWEVIVERDPAAAKPISLRVSCISTDPPGALETENRQATTAKLRPSQLRKRK